MALDAEITYSARHQIGGDSDDPLVYIDVQFLKFNIENSIASPMEVGTEKLVYGDNPTNCQIVSPKLIPLSQCGTRPAALSRHTGPEWTICNRHHLTCRTFCSSCL